METQATPMDRRTGRLQVRVYTVDEGAPISNAKVLITPRNSDETIEELTSDTAGLTQVVDLDAPPVEFSLTPETHAED